MCWRPREFSCESRLSFKIRGPSCEIVSDLHPKSFSHDWHVQPSCQRPNRTPPERRAFSPAGKSCVARTLMPATDHLHRRRSACTQTDSDCPRNPTNIPRCAILSQRTHPTESPQLFHSGNGSGQESKQPKSKPGPQTQECHSESGGPPGEEPALIRPRLKRTRQYGLPPGSAYFPARTAFRPNEGGRQKIEKRSFWRSLP